MEINLTNSTLYVLYRKTSRDWKKTPLLSSDLNLYFLETIEFIKIEYRVTKLEWFIENDISYPLSPISKSEFNRGKYNSGWPQSNWIIQSNCRILS